MICIGPEKWILNDLACVISFPYISNIPVLFNNKKIASNALWYTPIA